MSLGAETKGAAEGRPSSRRFVQRRCRHEVRFLPTIICFCIGAVAPLAMVGWILLR
jgi:hypothetical protein